MSVGLIVEVPDVIDRFVFVYVFVREMFYECLIASWWFRMHWWVVEVFEVLLLLVHFVQFVHHYF